jgi:hypothetical protein
MQLLIVLCIIAYMFCMRAMTIDLPLCLMLVVEFLSILFRLLWKHQKGIYVLKYNEDKVF